MEIKKVACVGAGQIGHGWATLFALEGYKVNLQSRKVATLKKAMALIRSNIEFLRQKGLIKKDEVETAFNRIETTRSIEEAVSGVEYVQESVAERYDVKKDVFKKMDASASEHTILASSTSGLLMTEIQKATTRPERCVIAHPILPTYLMPLVEIVGGEKTSRETVPATYNFMLKIGKTPVLLNREVPGHIVNRLQAALLREAIDLVDEGVASVEDVDKAFCMGIGLRDPILGPFLRIHLAGGGVERFINNYSQSYSYRWKTMETWTSIPYSAAKKVIKGVNEMEVVRTKTLEEIERWRDEKLVRLLKVISEE